VRLAPVSAGPLGGWRMTKPIVTKRLFRYEFVIRTTRSVAENESRLEAYLSNQAPPKGFFLADPRLSGKTDGATFTLRPWDALLWGTEVPVIEGYFVPNENGSDVLVRVGALELSRWLWLPIAGIVLVSFWSFSAGWEAGLTALFVAVIVFLLLAAPPLFHGSNAARVLAGVFSE